LETIDVPISLRKPQLEDAATMWRIVSEDEVLDTNSCYLYLLLCRDFAETCIVAEREGELVGFVTGYRAPSNLKALFVWQVVVAPQARRQGLAKRMILALAQSQPAHAIEFIEATITPSNAPSRALFAALASHWDTGIAYSKCFEPPHFGGPGHEAEELVRVGPIQEES
jgi:L-2,4-diaminobutyric acid acetyltransferase